jgi:peptidoglycan/xylan/chitin deacetylase (PgdA/CDA1 family)
MGFACMRFDKACWACASDGFAGPTLSVTVDDADITAYDNVLPTLADLNVKGFLYVTTDYVTRGLTYRDKAPRAAMTWRQIAEWAAAGHGVGSHTVTHAPLSVCSAKRLEQECVRSKCTLEDRLGLPIAHLSYPSGQHSRRTHKYLAVHGAYESAATIDRGMMFAGHDPLTIKRECLGPREDVAAMIRRMRMVDCWYWLRHIRPRPKAYWDVSPEEFAELLRDDVV